MFYTMFQPENDSPYAGKVVKLGTPIGPSFGTSRPGLATIASSTPI
jgi:hypothetical protein